MLNSAQHQAPLLRLLAAGIGACTLLLAGCSGDKAPPGAESAEQTAPVNRGMRAAVDPDKPRHVLFIVIDTLRADHMSSYGYWRETSPNIDVMAQEGVRFDRAISQSSWTSPSMVTLMTGRRVSRRRLSIPSDTPTLAQLFHDAGYRTGAFVANPLLNEKNGFHRGFDHWSEDARLVMTDAIVEWLNENKDRDTFTWVHFTDPHDPYKPRTRFDTDMMGVLTDHTEALLKLGAEQEGYGNLEKQRELMEYEIGNYDDEILWVDNKVLELLQALSLNDNLSNAIVGLTSDHGECLWERQEIPAVVQQTAASRPRTKLQHWLKQRHGGLVYQEFIRVPLIFMAPGLPKGEVVDSVAEAINVSATLLDLAGIDGEGRELVQGQNLFGGDFLPGAYAMTNQGEAFVADDGWKLILPTQAAIEVLELEVQLYDLNTDPFELVNLRDQQPEIVERLTQKIVERRESAFPLDSSFEQDVLRNLETLHDLGYVGEIVEDNEAEDR